LQFSVLQHHLLRQTGTNAVDKYTVSIFNPSVKPIGEGVRVSQMTTLYDSPILSSEGLERGVVVCGHKWFGHKET
jgi:hypothetical protein